MEKEAVVKAAAQIAKKVTPEQVLGLAAAAVMGYCQYTASYHMRDPFYYTNRIMSIATAYFKDGKKGPITEDQISMTRSMIDKADKQNMPATKAFLEKWLWYQKINPVGGFI